jgi:hypothetical protein
MRQAAQVSDPGAVQLLEPRKPKFRRVAHLADPPFVFVDRFCMVLQTTPVSTFPSAIPPWVRMPLRERLPEPRWSQPLLA